MFLLLGWPFLQKSLAFIAQEEDVTASTSTGGFLVMCCSGNNLMLKHNVTAILFFCRFV